MKKLRAAFCLIALLNVFQLFAQPTISSFTPQSGPVGTMVTISGSNFSTTSANNIVYFGAVRATVLSATATSLTVVVPAGASYQSISVALNNLTAYSNKAFIVTFPGGKSIINNPDNTQNSFAPKIDFTTDLHPNGITVADFDEDGKVDIATANNYSTTGLPASISILRNTGNSTIDFAPRIDISTGVLSYAIASGDLDGDGKIDLISSSITDKTISIFKNTSAGGFISFAPKMDLQTGTNPYSIAIAELNGDGKPDIVVANYLSNTISIYRNTSSGGLLSFSAKTDIATALAPHSIACGDFDGDGKNDIAVSNELSNSFSVFRNTCTAGLISFATKVDYVTGGNPYGIAAGDINADGMIDIVIANNSTANFSVFRNNTSNPGNISFALKADFSCGASPYNPLIYDFNGDGKPDIAVTSYNLSVHENNSSGTTISFSNKAYLYTTPAPFMVAAGDFDNDGKADLAGGIFTWDKISVLRNKNNEPTIRSVSPTIAASGNIVTITGANFSDVTSVNFGGVPATSFSIVNSTTITAVVGTGASGDVSVANQYGNASFADFVFIAPPTGSSITPNTAATNDTVTINGVHLSGATQVSFGGVAASSFTVVNNTKIKAVVGNGASGFVSVTTSYGKDSIAGFIYIPPPTITTFSPSSGGPGTSVTINGTNLTGASAVTVGGAPVSSFNVASANLILATIADGGSGSVSVTTSGGTATAGNFIFPKPTISSFFPLYGDSGTIITVTGSNFRNGALNNSVYFGAAKAAVVTASTTSLSVRVPTGATYVPISVVTNNNIALSDKTFNMTFADQGLSDSSFISNAAFTTPETPGRILMADFDGDGKSDVLTSNSGTISVLKNTTANYNTVSFTNAFVMNNISGVLGSGNRIDISIDDLNCDGKADIVLASAPNTITVLRNTSVTGSISFAPKIDLAVGMAGSLTTGDFDSDGKPDIACRSTNNGQWVIDILKNISVNQNLSFAPAIHIPINATGGNNLEARDIDGDGKIDLIAGNNGITVMRNTSTAISISFAAQVDFGVGTNQSYLKVADLDGDGKSDVVTSNCCQPNTYSIFRNTSTAGNLSFAAGTDYDLGDVSGAVVIGNLDGDAKPDLAIISANTKRVTVFSNTSTLGSITFGTRKNFGTRVTYNWMSDLAIGDINGDGKQDLAIVNGADYKVSILKNHTGEVTVAYCTESGASITSNLSGTTYQWQVDAGSGFSTIANNSNYNGSNSAVLQLSNIPASFNEYKYRCKVDANYSYAFTLIARITPPVPNIVANYGTTACSGTNIPLTSSSDLGSQWFLNGTTISGATFQTYYAWQSGNYSAIATSNGCSSAQSNVIAVNINPIVLPTITISNNGCSSGSIVFTTTILNGGSNPIISWYVNNSLFSTGQTFTLANPTIGTQVYAKLTSSQACANPQIVNSSTTTINCITTAIPNVDYLETFTVSPNPTNGVLVVQMKLRQLKKVSFKITDGYGRTVYTSEPANAVGNITKQIDLTGQEQGVYYLETTLSDKRFTEKIVVVR